MNIIFDLDGTLIDASDRMYQLFCKLIPTANLTKEEYWNMKRNKITHQMLLKWKYPEVDFDEFNQNWLNLIESEFYLNMDRNYNDTIEVLDVLYNKMPIYLLTARQSKEGLLSELHRLKLLRYFKKILVTEGKITKEGLLEKSCAMDMELANKTNWFISDVGKDIAFAKKMGYRTIAITHGFMCEEKLQEYRPQWMIHELKELLLLQKYERHL